MEVTRELYGAMTKLAQTVALRDVPGMLRRMQRDATPYGETANVLDEILQDIRDVQDDASPVLEA
jgi:hypothetical protein